MTNPLSCSSARIALSSTPEASVSKTNTTPNLGNSRTGVLVMTSLRCYLANDRMPTTHHNLWLLLLGHNSGRLEFTQCLFSGNIDWASSTAVYNVKLLPSIAPKSVVRLLEPLFDCQFPFLGRLIGRSFLHECNHCKLQKNCRRWRSGVLEGSY